MSKFLRRATAPLSRTVFRIAKRWNGSPLARRAWVRSQRDELQYVVLDCGDHQLAFNPRETIGRHIYCRGSWMRGPTDNILSFLGSTGALTRGKVLLEIGANIGSQTTYLMKSGAFSRAIAVEPDPRNFELLTVNTLLNGFVEQVSLHHCAVAGKSGSARLAMHAVNHGKSTLSVGCMDNGGGQDVAGIVEVDVKTVADLLEQSGLCIDDVGLIWMDIEGNELPVLKWLADNCSARTPLAMEFSPCLMGARASRDAANLLFDHYDYVMIYEGDERRDWYVPRQIERDELLRTQQCDIVAF